MTQVSHPLTNTTPSAMSYSRRLHYILVVVPLNNETNLVRLVPTALFFFGLADGELSGPNLLTQKEVKRPSFFFLMDSGGGGAVVVWWWWWWWSGRVSWWRGDGKGEEEGWWLWVGGGLVLVVASVWRGREMAVEVVCEGGDWGGGRCWCVCVCVCLVAS